MIGAYQYWQCARQLSDVCPTKIMMSCSLLQVHSCLRLDRGPNWKADIFCPFSTKFYRLTLLKRVELKRGHDDCLRDLHPRPSSNWSTALSMAAVIVQYFHPCDCTLRGGFGKFLSCIDLKYSVLSMGHRDTLSQNNFLWRILFIGRLPLETAV